MSVCAIGCQVTEQGCIALAVDILTGRLIQRASATTLAGAIGELRMDESDILGIGVATRISISSDELRRQFDYPISPATPTSHAHLIGAGIASPSTMLLTPETCVMNSRIEAAGATKAATLPEYFAYELAMPDDPDNVWRAMKLRAGIERLRANGVPVRRFVTLFDWSERSPALMQTFADVLGEKIVVSPARDPAALGAAILATVAAGHDRTGYTHPSQAIHAMSPRGHDAFRPDLAKRREYEPIYERERADHRQRPEYRNGAGNARMVARRGLAMVMRTQMHRGSIH